MNKIIKPKRKDWLNLTKRPSTDAIALNNSVNKIFSDIKENGDSALKKYSLLFDKVSLSKIKITEKEINNSANKISIKLLNDSKYLRSVIRQKSSSS